MRVILSSASVLALGHCLSVAPAMAQSSEQGVEANRNPNVIIVTATRREASLQDVPVAVQALGEEQLDQLGVSTFDDYLAQLPNVTAGGGGPGQNTIYIRGLASTTPNLTTAGVAGLAPNVALYLDEQPLSQPGRNLDVYATDLERIEVLSGPQGTLFGASSQAGTVRLITNKPELGVWSAQVNGEVAFTDGGDSSQSGEMIVNAPIGDFMALRGVVFLDHQGGYIDNVPGTVNAFQSGRFREAGTVRSNGVPVSPTREGFQAGADLSTVTFLNARNQGLVENDFNDTTYSGFRLAGRVEFNDDWSLTVAHMQQDLDADGVFFTDPTLGDLQVQRFEQDRLEDEFHNTSWTLEGRLGFLELVYSGAYTERDTEQRVDYTDYLFVGQYLPYYICDTAVVYPQYVTAAPANPTCQAPNLFVNSNTETSVFTQEFRVNTPSDEFISFTGGVFYSDLELEERNDFTYPGSVSVRGSDGVTPGFLPNFPLTNAAATAGARGNESTGYFSQPGPFPDGVIFRNDVRRTDEQFGLFGEATVNIIPDTFALTLGARYYDIEVDLEGSANSSFFNLRSPVFGPNVGVPLAQRFDAQLGGTNISAQYAENNPAGNPDVAATSGVILKATATWTPTDDLLFYGTFSEGFRPGLLNRPGGAQGPGGFVVPFELETDDVTNYEFGWKTSLFDRQLRFNGNIFYVEIENLQTTIFDPSITNLFFSDNAADAEVMGLEADLSWSPYAVPGLTIAGAFSVLDTEITDVLTPTDDVVAGSELAFAPSFQGNLRVRYEWDAGSDLTAHVMPQVAHSASSFTDIIEINKLRLDSWTTLGFSAGLARDNWSVEVFGENLTDERAQVSGNFVYDRARITVNRPLTVGLRFGFGF